MRAYTITIIINLTPYKNQSLSFNVVLYMTSQGALIIEYISYIYICVGVCVLCYIWLPKVLLWFVPTLTWKCVPYICMVYEVESKRNIWMDMKWIGVILFY